ncbi:hypothetical protein BKD09_16805 [Bradyrhizobium japonicum]|uniref:ABC transporter domain-containing protein n=1 Tax=Bradyrhizobium japonicum TaxID=375 RepID=A0A1L3F9K6_BRAJP|nr:sugar ABC transporter ATP-binding protein [Bradyrhizobium japonicum]APG09987.1 hypothetical protein BKD09_16805 [Bradyrhizobium japonicum]
MTLDICGRSQALDRVGEVISARGVCKSFGPSRVLSDIELYGRSGSIHAIAGENGAGKSTLMKIFAGALRPDAGTIRVNGVSRQFASPREAVKSGISTVFQELTILPNLSVAENMLLGREPSKFGYLDREAAVQIARDVLVQLGLDIDPLRSAGTLNIGEQQLVEIAKGFTIDASVFIFDEPTAALNRPEVERLERLLANLKDAGKAIFYITHRLDEIYRLCDMVTVMKDGRIVSTSPTSSINVATLVTRMVGRPIQQLFPARSAAGQGVILEARKLKVTWEAPEIDLQMERGEIVGLAGLQGQGQREIVRALAGVSPPVRGDVQKVDERASPTRIDLARGVRAALRAGIGFVPGDRKSEGLYLDLSIHANVAAGIFGNRPLGSIAPRVRSVVADLMKAVDLGKRDARQRVSSLSGGNQQKVLLARLLSAGVDVLLVEEPTRGVDVGAKAEIYRLLRQFAESGRAVLVVSSDLPEILGLCDRIMIVKGQRIVCEMPAATASEESVMNKAFNG